MAEKTEISNPKLVVHDNDGDEVDLKGLFKRPFCDEFMQFCFERFEVGIWSSAMESDQKQCTDSGFKTLENKGKPLLLKELNKLWNNQHLSLPWRKGRYSASNTLLIDDTPYKALLNPPNTAIFSDTYEVEGTSDISLGAHGELRLYLEGLATADDVPSYVMEHPFGQPPITCVHPDWDFYLDIIQYLNAGSADRGEHSSKDDRLDY
ncbi:PREDICTED: uncharacterized protein LOC104587544 [Nelumbo nucifera]|uniref:Mitochondrial import inner membrane translocase subunit TIM50 n=1 Tax=Nelumbo nucifera TaxID=4432 RepID=A0A1U8Q097_NELNU|nr:PREDICTED: uncharacterized protein LOC104587544 [Nelumbo nucifera]